MFILKKLVMNQLWKSFLEFVARQSANGSTRSLDGMDAAWAGSALLINNGTYLTTPVQGADDLDRRVAAAAADAAAQQMPWALYLYEPWTGMSREEASAIAARHGVDYFMSVQVMTADVRELKPPERPLPLEDLSFRRVQSEEDARLVLDLNVRAYGMPPEITDSVLATKSYFQDLAREFGYVAFDKNGTPVSTTTVVEIEGWLYVALVATDPDHRQKSYAEAVMRHALESTAAALPHITRTSLDATAMGAPVYIRMGYQSTGEVWSAYIPHH